MRTEMVTAHIRYSHYHSNYYDYFHYSQDDDMVSAGIRQARSSSNLLSNQNTTGSIVTSTSVTSLIQIPPVQQSLLQPLSLQVQVHTIHLSASVLLCSVSIFFPPLVCSHLSSLSHLSSISIPNFIQISLTIFHSSSLSLFRSQFGLVPLEGSQSRPPCRH